MNTSRLHGLDALRGIAALVVVFGHAIASVGDGTAGLFEISVDVFFCLSGYVMARTYEHRMPDAFSFLRIRWNRLWPTMAVGAILGGLVFTPTTRLEWLVVIAGVLLIPVSTRFSGTYPTNGAAWSILAELFANVLHGLILHRIKALHLAIIGAACIVGYRWWFGVINLGHTPETMFGGFIRATGSYCLGIALFRVMKDRSPLPAWPVFALPLLLLLPHEAPWAVLIVLIAPAFCVASAISFKPPPALSRLGAWSFPLYAVHMPIQTFLINNHAGFPLLILLPLATAAIISQGFPSRTRTA